MGHLSEVFLPSIGLSSHSIWLLTRSNKNELVNDSGVVQTCFKVINKRSCKCADRVHKSFEDSSTRWNVDLFQLWAFHLISWDRECYEMWC